LLIAREGCYPLTWHIPLLCQLKMTHPQFHLAAGTIIRYQTEGKVEQVQDSLHHGDYPQQSIKVQGLISSLYLEVHGLNG